MYKAGGHYTTAAPPSIIGPDNITFEHKFVNIFLSICLNIFLGAQTRWVFLSTHKIFWSRNDKINFLLEFVFYTKTDVSLLLVGLCII